MAARALGGPGDAASAALDELSRNFTYGAPGAGNGSLSRAWYRRNQVRAAAPPPRRPLHPPTGRPRAPSRRPRAVHAGRAGLAAAHADLTAPHLAGRGSPGSRPRASVTRGGSHRSAALTFAGSLLGLLAPNNPASPAAWNVPCSPRRGLGAWGGSLPSAFPPGSFYS